MLPEKLPNTAFSISDMANSTTVPMPYSGTHGPNRKPGFSHLCSGFEPEKNLRNTSSSTQPAHAPKKNKNTMSRKI